MYQEEYKRWMAADLEEKLHMRMEQQLLQKKHGMELLAERLEALSPLKKLSQGYAFVTGQSGQGICSAARVKPGDILNIHMLDGKVAAKAVEVELAPKRCRIGQTETETTDCQKE